MGNDYFIVEDLLGVADELPNLVAVYVKSAVEGLPALKPPQSLLTHRDDGLDRRR